MGRLKTGLILLGITAALLLCLEFISGYILSQIYNRAFDASMIIENKYGSSAGLKANIHGKVWGHRFTTDEMGGRITSGKKQNKRVGKKKWLFIGDSVTEGVGVDDHSHYSNLFAQQSEMYDIRNISLIGYATADYVEVISHLMIQDSTIDRVSVFYCLNDVYGSSKSNELPVMAQKGIFYRINHLLAEQYDTYRLLKLYTLQNASKYFEYDLQFYKKDNNHYKQAMNDLQLCDSICQTRQVKFEVVLLPYKSQLTGNKNRTPQTLVGQFLSAGNIRFIDATDFLASHHNTNEMYLWADEIHFSDTGHRAVATYLQQALHR
ncbi:MAG: SGNH/GDSL hydrolase family protein [Bacteroidetes bacterium]|nr:SGNH/GDSL hydrolase family protein [Bacteroidota bacterium]